MFFRAAVHAWPGAAAPAMAMAKKRSPELRLIRVDHVAGEATEDHRVEVRLVIGVEHVENRAGDLVEGRLTRRRAAGMVEIVDAATRILHREGLPDVHGVPPGKCDRVL
jgi:hypothetical protein